MLRHAQYSPACTTAICLQAVVLGIGAGPVRAESGVSAGDYCKSFFVAYRNPESIDPGPVLGSVTNRLRVNVSWAPAPRLSFALAYDVAPMVQDHSLFETPPTGLRRLESNPYRAADFDARLYPAECDSVRSFAVFQNLDRSLVTIRASFADFHLGRQPVTWGSARVVNPTDIIAPFTFDRLDTEDRPGADAARARIPLGMLSELDVGYLAGNDFRFEESAVFLRSRLYVRRTDVSPVVIAFRQNLLLGLDLARSLGGAGSWVEVGVVLVDVLDADASASEDYVRVSAGLDYNLARDAYGYLEYHFNGPGSTEPEAYQSRLAGAAYSEGGVYLVGKHYAAPGITYQITPLFTFTGQAVVNLSDRSASVSPQIEWNVAENVYARVGAFLGLGDSPVGAASGEDPPYIVRSEFGAYPDVLFSSFRIYF